MKVIVLASQKGGVGKSTLAAHLAVEAEWAGHGPAALIDTDPQGSLSAWWNIREAQTPTFAQVNLSKLLEQISQLGSNKIKLVFIDTPPALSEPIRIVAKTAHLILVPVRPSTSPR
jgi:chromosome partitioning protein